VSRDAVACAAIVERCARTFAAAGRFLPGDKRRAANAVYAFCRIADDLVDVPAVPERAAIERELDVLERSLARALDGAPEGAVMRELAWAVRRFGIPEPPLRDLVAAVRSDLEPRAYASWRELEAYCAGVASTVGVVCAHVFGLPGEPPQREAALRHARTLGLAMQLTNILRDVGEDGRAGRCYLPEDDMATFGVRREEILAGTIAPADARWRALLTFQMGRARALYASAEPGIALLAADAQRCARMCAVGYARILDAITAIGYDALGRRARVGAAARLATLAGVWWETRRPLPRADHAAPHAAPHGAPIGMLARVSS
jgi:phytoene synthase